MAQYPPPPQPDQQHYSALFPAQPPGPQLIDSVHEDQLQYNGLNQTSFNKGEPNSPSHHATDNDMHRLARELQHHAAFEDHHSQQAQHVVQHVQTQSSQGQASAMNQSEKPNRLRKACDSCSIRKVKCDEGGPPCRACVALDIPCTFERPSRRRGPPNRHAEAIKRRRLEDGSALLTGLSSPSSPTHAARALAALSAHPPEHDLSAETICPLDTLNLLIDDFFAYMHPFSPVPHEPSFREAWKRREDLNNKRFLALLASMVSALMSSFPQRPRLNIKLQKKDPQTLDHVQLALRCQKICTLARGPGYLESDSLNVYDAITSSFLGLTNAYMYKWRQCRMYFAEALTILQTLGLHRQGLQSHVDGTAHPTGIDPFKLADQVDSFQHIDNITVEMGRRLFWTLFINTRTLQQFGISLGSSFIPPDTPSQPHPPLPTEVDDFCIYPEHNESQPEGLLSIIAGFNASVRLHRSYNTLAALELALGSNRLIDKERKAQVLHECLRACREILKGLPTELSIPQSAESNHMGQSRPDFAAPNMTTNPAASLSSFLGSAASGHALDKRRQMQHEAQKMDLYASSLTIRFSLVDQFSRIMDLCESPKDLSPTDLATLTAVTACIYNKDQELGLAEISIDFGNERENTVVELLTILGKIELVNMEANGDNFISKIRSITALLQNKADSQKGDFARRMSAKLDTFLNTLARLEGFPDPNTDALPLDRDEEQERRDWAALHDCQVEFTEAVENSANGD